MNCRPPRHQLGAGAAPKRAGRGEQATTEWPMSIGIKWQLILLALQALTGHRMRHGTPFSLLWRSHDASFSARRVLLIGVLFRDLTLSAQFLVSLIEIQGQCYRTKYTWNGQLWTGALTVQWGTFYSGTSSAYDVGPGHTRRQTEGDDEGSWKSSPRLDLPPLPRQGTCYIDIISMSLYRRRPEIYQLLT